MPPPLMLLPLAVSPANDQTFWIGVAAAGALGLYVLMRPRGKKRRDGLDEGPRFSLARQREVEQQMNNLLVELSQMARQITAQLDTRASKLELLIKEADERLAALRAAGDGVHVVAEAKSRPASENVLAADEAAALQTLSVEPATPPPPPPPRLDERHAEIYALADEGKAANEIARILHRPAGEIELILALRPK
jgi:DNA repair exonuclease SbcCD ATPase subunit